MAIKVFAMLVGVCIGFFLHEMLMVGRERAIQKTLSEIDQWFSNHEAATGDKSDG